MDAREGHPPSHPPLAHVWMETSFHREDGTRHCQVGLFSAQNHDSGFFRVSWAFFGKKPTKFGFFGRFLGVDRKLLKFLFAN